MGPQWTRGGFVLANLVSFHPAFYKNFASAAHTYHFIVPPLDFLLILSIQLCTAEEVDGIGPLVESQWTRGGPKLVDLVCFCPKFLKISYAAHSYRSLLVFSIHLPSAFI